MTTALIKSDVEKQMSVLVSLLVNLHIIKHFNLCRPRTMVQNILYVSVAEFPLWSWKDSRIIPHIRDLGMECLLSGMEQEWNGLGSYSSCVDLPLALTGGCWCNPSARSKWLLKQRVIALKVQ